MENLKDIAAPVIAKMGVVANFLTTKKGLAVTAPATATAIIVDVGFAIKLLIALIIADFITGVGASFEEWKKEHPDKQNRPRLISSEKLRKSGYKMFFYFGIVYLAYHVERVFLINPFRFSWSKADFTITVCVTVFLCIIEAYSIIWENFPRMGFDIVGRIKKIWKSYKTTKDEL